MNIELQSPKVRKLIEEFGYAKTWYEQYEKERSEFDQDWEDASELTLPYLYPPGISSGSDIQEQLPTPYNSIGPASVNALASKLLLALLPPTGVFFRLLPDDEEVTDLSEEELKQLDKELSKLEQDVVQYINEKALRIPVFEALKYLIVTGNVGMYKVPNGSFKVFAPYQYVVQRDYVGNILTAAIKERIGFNALPQDVQEKIEEAVDENTNEEQSENKEVDIYTFILRTNNNSFTVWQEINKYVLEDTVKTYTKDKLPYIFLRWTTINSEDYGRGHVQQYLGDLRSLEGLTQSIVEGAGISALTLFGVRPGSTLKVEDLNNASNGEFVLGDLEREISTLQIQKAGDYQVAMTLIQQLEQRLARAFLMLGGQIRDSERTTATEVRQVAAELEATLGGVYSVLAAEFQKPLITLVLQEMMPDVLKFTTPTITTGITAISRERDYQNLNVMVQTIAQLGPEVMSQYLNISGFLSQLATSLGMDPAGVVRTDEEIQAIQQQQQQMMMQQQAMQQALQTGGKVVEEGARNSNKGTQNG
ncbi:MAG: hypothetical protein B6U76_00085 [Desulfurococcales archaeon ex4484_217_2]|nr:MAG: hypothetical protein B6U76_00085 [Desulfurococcales archaeon ex4484_217_2]